jgi:hypothetical protein
LSSKINSASYTWGGCAKAYPYFVVLPTFCHAIVTFPSSDSVGQDGNEKFRWRADRVLAANTTTSRAIVEAIEATHHRDANAGMQKTSNFPFLDERSQRIDTTTLQLLEDGLEMS